MYLWAFIVTGAMNNSVKSSLVSMQWADGLKLLNSLMKAIINEKQLCSSSLYLQQIKNNTT